MEGESGSRPLGLSDDSDDSDDATLPAGGFSAWLRGMEAALRGDAPSDVACRTCTACCTSSQFIHVGPDEADALAHIPRALLFPAPGAPNGHMLMGYDANGHCPMFRDNACSIYAHRPQTCRTYDCRIFAATGVEVPDEDMPLIAAQARRWRFEELSDDDRAAHAAVQRAAAALRENPTDVTGGVVPANATQLAVLAIRHRDRFREDAPS